jgi:hypothetical protein
MYFCRMNGVPGLARRQRRCVDRRRDAHSLVDEGAQLDNDLCCNPSRSSSSVRVGAAYFFH